MPAEGLDSDPRATIAALRRNKQGPQLPYRNEKITKQHHDQPRN